MAGPYYVRSTDGSDADSGLTWALAKATIAGAAAVMAAGERCWLSQVHAETQATNMTITSPGTATAPCEFLCGNDAAEPPTALATTATVSTTGNTTISFNGFAYFQGITFNLGSGSGAGDLDLRTAASAGFIFENCAFVFVETGSGGMEIGSSSTGSALVGVLFQNCSVTFAGTGQAIKVRGRFVWRKGSIAGATLPTTLFAGALSIGAMDAELIGVDLSVLGSGKNLVDVSVISSGCIIFSNCKLGASVAVTTGTPGGSTGLRVLLDNCDSADTNYRMQRHQYEGDVYSETTIVRTGGASDGTTGLSHKYVSSASSKFYAPLYGPDLVIWNDIVGASQTVTAEILHDSVTALTDAEVWLETEYLGTTGFPLSLFANDRAADILATPANQTASSATWTTTGMTNPNKQKLVTTQTPQEKGYYRCRVALAKASHTVYADPMLTVA